MAKAARPRRASSARVAWSMRDSTARRPGKKSKGAKLEGKGAQAVVKLNVGVLRNVPGSLIVVANDKNLFERKGPFELVLPGKFLSGGGPELLPAVV